MVWKIQALELGMLIILEYTVVNISLNFINAQLIVHANPKRCLSVLSTGESLEHHETLPSFMEAAITEL